MPCIQPESVFWSRQWKRFLQQIQSIYRTHIIIGDEKVSVLLCCPSLQLQWQILEHYVSRLVRAFTWVEIWPISCHLKGKIIFVTRPLDDRLGSKEIKVCKKRPKVNPYCDSIFYPILFWTRSLGALRAPTSSCRPFGHLCMMHVCLMHTSMNLDPWPWCMHLWCKTFRLRMDERTRRF